MIKLKYVKLFENFNKEGIIISNSYSKDGFKIYLDDKKWKNKLPKINGQYLLHNTSSKNLDSILSNGLTLKKLGISASNDMDSHFGRNIISHHNGDASLVVIFSDDEYTKLRSGVENDIKYNFYIKDGVIPSERILGYIEIPNTNDGKHNESLIFYPNDKFNLNVKLNIKKEEIQDVAANVFGVVGNQTNDGDIEDSSGSDWD
jgi:hypothetical protein